MYNTILTHNTQPQMIIQLPNLLTATFRYNISTLYTAVLWIPLHGSHSVIPISRQCRQNELRQWIWTAQTLNFHDREWILRPGHNTLAQGHCHEIRKWRWQVNMATWKTHWRKGLWPNLRPIPASAGRNWGTPWKPQLRQLVSWIRF
jgi:hypothetical protein